MGKIQFSLLVNDMRGKHSGGVLLTGKGGNSFRKRRKGVNRQTAAQTAVRNTFTTNSKGFSALTAAQIAAWNAGAVNFPYKDIFGDTKYLSGKTLYGKLNNNIVLAGGSAISAIPSPSTVSGPTGFAIATNSTTAQSLTWTGGAVPTSTAFVIMATRGLSNGTSSPGRSAFRKISTQAAAATSPANTFSAYQSVFGTPAVGKKIFFKIFAVNLLTGQVSTALVASSVTV